MKINFRAMLQIRKNISHANYVSTVAEIYKYGDCFFTEVFQIHFHTFAEMKLLRKDLLKIPDVWKLECTA